MISVLKLITGEIAAIEFMGFRQPVHPAKIPDFFTAVQPKVQPDVEEFVRAKPGRKFALKCSVSKYFLPTYKLPSNGLMP